ncbi:MAG TPA: cation:proton antiporter [Bryobacteraceae bacterium]|nr:cation:proton antiporter [Bryobacteraceae bacterium]HPU74104.1 cation:proton antiporter [Bryobacteraceae bacterium]
MHNVELILTLGAGFAVALISGFVALRLKLPAIVGYLVAGLILGPHTPGFVANRGIAEQLAEVGVILLMFGVGMHFHLKDLLAVRRIAVVGALVQSSMATLLGLLVGHACGWSWSAGLVFGLSLSVASTVVLTRVLSDHGDLHTRSGRIAIGWLVFEDIFTVFVLVVLPAIFAGAKADSSNLPAALGITTVKLIALTALTLGPGGKLLPRLLTAAARTGSRELFTLTVLTIAIGISVGSAAIFGVSMALGAFLAGMVVGQSEFSYRAASEALPMRDAFAVLFFVSVGMLFDPQHLLRQPVLTAAAIGIVMLGKPLAAILIVVPLGYGLRIALRVATALAQVGEFSFMLTVLGDQLGVLPSGATDSVVAAAIVSITLNPVLYRALPALERRLAKSGVRKLLEPRAGKAIMAAHGDHHHQPDEGQPRAIIIGYGPVGETVVRLLSEHDFIPTVIELNIDTIRRLQRRGIRAVYGNAAQPDVLRQAGVAAADTLILSAPGASESYEIIRVAREINPRIQVLARSQFLSQTSALREAGADLAFSGEAEVAIAMVDAILQRVGATPEQMDKERERTRTELYKLANRSYQQRAS